MSGTALMEGYPEKSAIVQRIKGLGGKPVMPLGFAPLSREQISLLEQWIAEGAKSDEGPALHWAYIAPVRPPLPTVKNTKWVRNPIDAFVLATLEKSSLTPSPEASKETLIRRVSLDLTGLPPSTADVDKILLDKRPDAYERLVDRLLASHHYGERQARFWLDLARYADTDGFADLPRKAWKYRDWVIEAFNKNMPFDQFTIEQLAGDLLPRTDVDRFIATGFHRNSMFDAEMGGDPEEAHLNVIADRVSVTSTVWLGSTLQCARCHDHKFDPFTQKDFYAMAAFYNGTSHTPTNPGEAKGRWIEPLLEFPTSTQVAKRQQLAQKIATTERSMKRWTPEKRTALAEWREKLKNPGWVVQDPKLFARSGTRFKKLADGSALALGITPEDDRNQVSISGIAEKVTGVRIEFIPDSSFPKKGSGRAQDGSFILTKVRAALNDENIKIVAASSDYSYQDIRASNLLKETPNSGWSQYKQVDKPHELILEFAKPIELRAGSRFTLDLYQEGEESQCTIGRFRVSLATADHPSSLVTSADVKELLAKDTLEKEEQEAVESAFFEAAPMFASQRLIIEKAIEEKDALSEKIPTAMILQEHAGKEPLKIPLRLRGEFLNKGPDVFANTPGVLPPLKTKARVDRLALAKWLVSKQNPLTARVLANRLWEQSFGRGIVETSEDFGIRGSLPTHPELLDWMATELQNGWNIKALQRKIVTSATYRQSSKGTAAALQRDAKNTMLARGPKVRLDAETVRDASLAYGGLLYRKVGGPSVFPYQPAEATENNADWSVSHGPDAYRRSLYTFLQRSYPYALFQIFDAANRAECTVRRINTTTPLQALALLNDRGMTEAADALGRRMLGSAKRDDLRLATGFRICTSRNPTKVELGVLQRLLTQMRQRYSIDPKSAKDLSGTPERSAWTMVGNVLLNMDETINRN